VKYFRHSHFEKLRSYKGATEGSGHSTSYRKYSLLSMLNQIEIQTYLWWLVVREWPQPQVEIGCGGFTGADDCVQSFLYMEALGEKWHEHE